MPGDSKIEWTDATWNPVTGCTKVSAGCDHCYAEVFAERFRGVPGHPYEQGFDLKLWPERLLIPLRWVRPRRIFVNSMSDLFHADVPEAFIIQVFATMAATPRHTYQVLTKRPQRMKRLMIDSVFVARVSAALKTIHLPHMMPGSEHGPWPGWPLPNVWLGTSVEDQAAAFRIDWLVRTPAVVRFLSCEPLLGPIDLTRWIGRAATPEEQAAFRAAFPEGIPDTSMNARISRWQEEVRRTFWVIAGGESGAEARPMHPDWARNLRDQCIAGDVPFFFKQWGEWVEADGPRCQRINQEASRKGMWMDRDGTVAPRSPENDSAHSVYHTSLMARLGKKHAGREQDGRTWDEMPAVAS